MLNVDKTGTASQNRFEIIASLVSVNYRTNVFIADQFFYDTDLNIRINRAGKTLQLVRDTHYYLYGKVAGLFAENGASAYRAIVFTSGLKSDDIIGISGQYVGGTIIADDTLTVKNLRKNINTKNSVLIIGADDSAITFELLATGNVQVLEKFNDETALNIEKKAVQKNRSKLHDVVKTLVEELGFAETKGLPEVIDEIVFGSRLDVENSGLNHPYCANLTKYAGGADPTGVVPASDAIMAAAKAVYDTGRPGVVFLASGTYLLDKTVKVPANVFILPIMYAPGSTPLNFKFTDSADLIDGWSFLFNSEDGVTAETGIYQNNYQNGLFGARLNNYSTNYPNIRGAMCFGSAFFQDIRAYRLMCAIKRPASYYCDRWAVVRFGADQPHVDSTEYQIEFDGTGDSVIIDRCTFPDSGGLDDIGDGSPIKAIRFKNSNSLLSCASADVRGVINGDMYFRGVKALSVRNYHGEYGVLTFDQTNFTIEDSYIAVPSKISDPSIVCLGSSNNDRVYFGKFRNVEFNYGFHGFLSNQVYQIRTHHEYLLAVSNTYRVVSISGAAGALLGVKICKSDGSSVDSWNKWSHLSSSSGELTGYVLSDISRFYNIDSSYSGVYYAASASSQTDFDSPVGSYYYTSQYLIDPTNMVGVSQGSEQTVQITDTNGKGIFLTLSCGNLPNNAVIRVYRGRAAGSYSEYADIHAAMLKNVQDTGTKVCGISWTSRTPGPIDTMRSGSITGTSGVWQVSTNNGAIRCNTTYTERQNTNGSYGVYGGDSVTEYTQALTADRFIGIPNNGSRKGDKARVVRAASCTGAFKIHVQGLGGSGSNSITLNLAGQWCDLLYDGTKWTHVASGSLILPTA